MLYLSFAITLVVIFFRCDTVLVRTLVFTLPIHPPNVLVVQICWANVHPIPSAYEWLAGVDTSHKGGALVLVRDFDIHGTQGSS
jgi:hypothetical protein